MQKKTVFGNLENMLFFFFVIFLLIWCSFVPTRETNRLKVLKPHRISLKAYVWIMHQLIFILNQIFTICKFVRSPPPSHHVHNPISSVACTLKRFQSLSLSHIFLLCILLKHLLKVFQALKAFNIRAQAVFFFCCCCVFTHWTIFLPFPSCGYWNNWSVMATCLILFSRWRPHQNGSCVQFYFKFTAKRKPTKSGWKVIA